MMGKWTASAVLTVLVLLAAMGSVARGDRQTHGAVVAVVEDSAAKAAAVEDSAAKAAAVEAEVAYTAPEDPTAENGWRELGKDEAVKRGAHVQLNMATGKKYVKEGCAAEARVDAEPRVGAEGDRLSMMERILYGLPSPDPKLPSASARKSMSPEEYRALLDRVWAIRQEEIRKAMESAEDHGAMIRNLTAAMMNATLVGGEESLVQTLEDVEWIVQDIDHALHFVSLGGIDLAVRLLDHESPRVRAMAAYAAGSAIKSHAVMQEAALKAGLVGRTLDKLAEQIPCHSADGSGEREAECGKLLYALSSVVRGNAAAQAEAVAGGLLATLADLVAAGQPLSNKVLVKVLALVQDSFSEWEGCAAEWAVNATDERVCLGLVERAQSLANEQASEPALAEDGTVREVADKLVRALDAARCAVPDALKQSPLFLP